MYDEFCRLAMLSDYEKEILEERIKHYSLTQQASKHNCSPATISRAVKEIQDKYDAVQPYSDILPVRTESEEEKWMNTH